LAAKKEGDLVIQTVPRGYGALKWFLPLLALLIVIGIAAWGWEWRSQPTRRSPPIAVPGGDATQGRLAIAHYGCGACHVVPGVSGASGLVGPPLSHWAGRSYIAGAVPNSQEYLIRWLVDPQTIEPGTAMPNLNISEQDARHIAAYLYTLQ
jgi:cytochrome c